jgi:hypothetical protein
MKKIFHLGSCRTALDKFSDKNFTFTKNYDLTHTTKEVLMYLDLFDGIKKIDGIERADNLMYNPENFIARRWDVTLKQADAVIIEICSLKIIKHNNDYYQINRVYAKPDRSNFPFYIQTEEEFAADIKLIQQRINKPILFVGHVNHNFYDIEGIKGYIKERGILDSYIKKYCTNYLILGETDLVKHDYKKVFSFWNREDDTTHLSLFGTKLVCKEIKKKLKKIIKRVYMFGACRTRHSMCGNSKEGLLHGQTYFINYGMTHTTKEVLTYIDLLQDKIKLEDIQHPDCLFGTQTFNLGKYKRYFERSNVALIEISSLKILEHNGTYYNMAHVIKNNRGKEFISYVQTEEEFAADVKLIQSRLNMPVIFVGHLNYNFSFENIGYINDRNVLDYYIGKHCKHHVILGKYLKDYKYEDLFDHATYKTNDTNHLTQIGSKVLFDAVYSKIKNV